MKKRTKRGLIVALGACLALSMGALAACQTGAGEHEHVYTSWRAGIAATCTEEGTEIAKCDVCGEESSRTVDALGHDWVAAGGASATCTRCGAPAESDANQTIEYTFRVVRTNGELVTFAGIEGFVLNEEGGIVTTLKLGSGEAKAKLPSARYTVRLIGMPEGYTAEATYTVSPENPVAALVLTGSLRTGTPDASVRYAQGSAMYDFTLTTVATSRRPQSETLTLSELLKTKKMVMLNFWYVGCTFCGYEFPGMEMAYQQYQDDIAIIAIDPLDSNSNSIKNFADSYGLSFYIAKDGANLNTHFNVSAYPMSVIIDQEGIVSEIHKEALVNPSNAMDNDYSMREFAAIFAKYAGGEKNITGASALGYALPRKEN